jgi:predicted O-methyltransferase YrrM
MSYEFTVNWAMPLAASLQSPQFTELFSKPVHVLELGVYEGRSSTMLIERMLPGSTYTGIDRWYSAPDHLSAGVEKLARSNVTKATEGRDVKARLLKGYTSLLVPQLGDGGYDFIYIDADHSFSAALQDTQLVWPKLKVRGILLWDDVTWHKEPHAMYGAVGHAMLDFMSQKPGHMLRFVSHDQVGVIKLKE